MNFKLSIGLYLALITSVSFLAGVQEIQKKDKKKINQSEEEMPESSEELKNEKNSEEEKQPENKKKSKNNNDGSKKDDKAGSKNNDDKTPKKSPIVLTLGDSEIRTWVRLRIPEFFYGKNLRLLNNNNPTDRIIFFRHTLDLNTEYRYFNPYKKYDIIFAKMNIRNKGVWGDPESIASTTFSTVRILDSVAGSHQHAIPLHIWWIRELWIQLNLAEFLAIPFCNNHTLSIGSFPFELGRGIALGTAYKIDPSDLGFYAEAAIDQYAFGAKLSGVLAKDALLYDLYAAILDNKSTNFGDTNLKIRGQQFGHRNDQARGFGIINYLIAARTRWSPVIRPNVNIYLEPYILYNRNPEQKIEFTGDAESNLITIGLASECAVGNFEWGFDTAFNLGSQRVHGWDRNAIKLESRDGTVVQINTQVKQITEQQLIDRNLNINDPKLCEKVKSKAIFVPQNQEIIDTSEQSASQNGKIIGQNDLGILINDCERFVDPYRNIFNGSMFVFDMGYYIIKPDLKIAAAFGFASGDMDPNRDLEKIGDSQIDGDYEGFIGLQETYSGTRVKSAFLLSGPGRPPRLLSFPSRNVTNPFTTVINRFTNIIFTGGAINWQPKCAHNWILNPNLLAYWQEDESRIFDEELKKSIQSQFASPFIGVELNIFVEAEVLQGLYFYCVGAVFFPGSHFKDVKGRPLNKAQQTFLDNLDRTGIVNDRVPLLGNDESYFANLGFEYKF